MVHILKIVVAIVVALVVCNIVVTFEIAIVDTDIDKSIWIIIVATIALVVIIATAVIV